MKKIYTSIALGLISLFVYSQTPEGRPKFRYSPAKTITTLEELPVGNLRRMTRDTAQTDSLNFKGHAFALLELL